MRDTQNNLKFEKYCQMRFVCSQPTKFSLLIHRLLTSSIVPRRVEPYSQLPLLLVHWSYRKRNYPCNTIRVRRCTPTNARRIRSTINCTYRRKKTDVYWLYYLCKCELYLVRKTAEFQDKFTKSL